MTNAWQERRANLKAITGYPGYVDTAAETRIAIPAPKLCHVKPLPIIRYLNTYRNLIKIVKFTSNARHPLQQL
jgi:hypothetical protein